MRASRRRARFAIGSKRGGRSDVSGPANLTAHKLRGDRGEQDAIPVVAIGQPKTGIAEAMDHWPRRFRGWTEANPCGGGPMSAQPRQQMVDASGDLTDNRVVDGTIEAPVFRGSTADRETVGSLE